MPDDIQPVPPEQAREILDAAIRNRLGDDWDSGGSGWLFVTGHAYMARLTKGRTNMDFYVDLLGDVTVEEKQISPAQEGGRLAAWLVLAVSLTLALLFARVIGWL